MGTPEDTGPTLSRSQRGGGCSALADAGLPLGHALTASPAALARGWLWERGSAPATCASQLTRRWCAHCKYLLEYIFT